MAAFPLNHRCWRRLPLFILAAWCASAVATTANAQAPAFTEGYEVSRSQIIEQAPPDSVGRISVDREESVGNTDATLGNKRSLELKVGTIAKKCPTADGIVTGRFEYALIVHDDVTVAGERRQANYWQQLTADLVGHVTDEAELDYVEFKGVFSRINNGTHIQQVNSTIPHQTTFRPGALGELDYTAALRAVEKTGEIAFAMAMSLASPVLKDAQREWSRQNQCVEFSFDPTSETVALTPNESRDVRVRLQTKGETQAQVGEALLQVSASQGVGAVSPGSAIASAQEPTTFTYTASAQPRRGQGFSVVAKSRAGAAAADWKIGDGDLKLTIEHRRWDDVGTPRGQAGYALFDGTVRFDLTLPRSGFENQYRATTSIVRNMTVGHVKQCRGTASQTEDWDVRVTADPVKKTLRVDANVYRGGDGRGQWGGCGPLTIFPRSDPTPVELPAIIGQPQTFQIPRSDGNHETLTVTIVSSPLTR